MLLVVTAVGNSSERKVDDTLRLDMVGKSRSNIPSLNVIVRAMSRRRDYSSPGETTATGRGQGAVWLFLMSASIRMVGVAVDVVFEW